jgi:carbonic anhydrase
VVDAGIAGSVEYAIGVLGVSLVLVLGHEACGALKEAVNAVMGGGPISPNLDLLVESLTVPVLRVLDQPGDLLDNAIRSNVRFGVDRLSGEPEIAPFIRDGTVRVVGGEYRLNGGLVELLS